MGRAPQEARPHARLISEPAMTSASPPRHPWRLGHESPRVAAGTGPAGTGPHGEARPRCSRPPGQPAPGPANGTQYGRLRAATRRN